jgi:hypothetical protein
MTPEETEIEKVNLEEELKTTNMIPFRDINAVRNSHNLEQKIGYDRIGLRYKGEKGYFDIQYRPKPKKEPIWITRPIKFTDQFKPRMRD